MIHLHNIATTGNRVLWSEIILLLICLILQVSVISSIHLILQGDIIEFTYLLHATFYTQAATTPELTFTTSFRLFITYKNMVRIPTFIPWDANLIFHSLSHVKLRWLSHGEAKLGDPSCEMTSHNFASQVVTPPLEAKLQNLVFYPRLPSWFEAWENGSYIHLGCLVMSAAWAWLTLPMRGKEPLHIFSTHNIVTIWFWMSKFFNRLFAITIFSLCLKWVKNPYSMIQILTFASGINIGKKICEFFSHLLEATKIPHNYKFFFSYPINFEIREVSS